MRRPMLSLPLAFALFAMPVSVQARDMPSAVSVPAAVTPADLAKRVVSLEHGSNFRDIGGYRTADGRTVRWGMIYRSGGTPLLTDADVATVKGLGIGRMVDLRSSEERALAPTRLDGIPYSAIGYSLAPMLAGGSRKDGTTRFARMEQVYRGFPETLAPQVRLVFRSLLESDRPLVYNCSAGQDRTGFVTAVLLSALGVSRQDVERDYLLSTQLRRPLYEMPRIDPAQHAGDPVAAMFAGYQQGPDADKAQPLYDANGPYIRFALDEIVTKWGSIDNYLAEKATINAADLALLKARYTQ